MDPLSIKQIAEQIKILMHEARAAASHELNSLLIKTNWDIGRTIIAFEQDGNVRASYGKRLLTDLSKELSRDLGKGFSRSNLQNMRRFYLFYSNLPDASGKLTWSHFCELISVSDADARKFYEQECANANWSVRELKRQIKTSLFERLLLSDGKANKDAVLALSRQGIAMAQPQDILKNPYVFEFLGVREEKPQLEKDLERRLIRHSIWVCCRLTPTYFILKGKFGIILIVLGICFYKCNVDPISACILILIFVLDLITK